MFDEKTKESIQNSVGTTEFISRYKEAYDSLYILSKSILNVVNAIDDCPHTDSNIEMRYLSAKVKNLATDYIEANTFLASALDEHCKVLGITANDTDR
jgi:hypothetical protein